MSKYTVVTTFNAKGYDQYAQKFLRTFDETWPKDVNICVYTENCEISENFTNLKVIDLHQASADLLRFKMTWKNVPKANGDVTDDPIRSKRGDAGKGFKWDAIRFSHKVYSIFHCADNISSEILIWMDADMICHSKITLEQISHLIPMNVDICYLGREGKYSECGLYSMNLASKMTLDFLKEFKRMYDQAEQGIFLLDEWHDSFVFDEVMKKFPHLRKHNWSAHLSDLRPTKRHSKGEGHPLINCDWGKYLDHLKGSRKNTGKSLPTDLIISRNEKYWQ
ncbi:hypothetical protein EB118_00285 [bacterium]|nr:hypothetical protein [bacterium]